MTPENGVVQVRLSALRWALAQWLLAIWNPDLVDFLRDAKKRRRSRLRYRSKGIVLHDRALNGGFDT